MSSDFANSESKKTATGMATAPEVNKDVFVVHSRSGRLHEAIYNRLRTSAGGLGIALYDYGDWQWETPGAQDYKNYGTPGQMDPVLYSVRDPHPFCHETRKPDEDAVSQLWSDSRVVLILEAAGKPSEGMLAEMNFLKRYYGRRLWNPPIMVSVDFPQADPLYLHGLSIAFRFDAPDTLDEEEVSKQILALVLVCWLVHILRSFGTAGYFVLAEASAGNPIVRQIVETSPGHRDLDFRVLEEESRARGARETPPAEEDIAKYVGDRIAAISNESDREAMWNSKVPRAVSWLRKHRGEHDLIEAACVVADRFEDQWATAYERFRYAVGWPA